MRMRELQGVLEHGPSGPKPNASSAYDLTSVAASMHYHFNTKSFLTKRYDCLRTRCFWLMNTQLLPFYDVCRDAWAAPFNHLLNQRSTPRTDCPTKLPDPPESSGAFKGARGRQLTSGNEELSTLQRELLQISANLQFEEESDEDFQTARLQVKRLETEMEGVSEMFS